MKELNRAADRIVPVERAEPRGWSWRRSGLSLALAAGVGCGLLPLLEASGKEEPWMASVHLSVADPSGKTSEQALGAARKLALSRETAGRAVDLLGLEADPEYGAASPSALQVALEILAGDGGGSVDARTRAVDTVLSNLKLDTAADKSGLTLLVKSASSEKAAKVAEAMATAYSASGEVTGSIAAPADKIRQDTAAKAEADLAAYRKAVGPDKLATASVLKKRLDTLDQQMVALKAEDPQDQPGAALLKATLNDVLAGRLAGGIDDPALEQARQDYIGVRMTYDQLAASLGPKHPRLLAAQSDVEASKKALADQFTRSKQAAVRLATEARKALDDLSKARASAAASLQATGVDLERLAQLQAEADAARSALDDIVTGSIPKSLLHFTADAPKVIASSADGLLWAKVLLSALAGFAAVFGGFYFRKRMMVQGESDPAPARAIAPETTRERPKPRQRLHRAANYLSSIYREDDADDADTEYAPYTGPARPSYSRRERRGDVPVVEKLRRIAPHVFAEEDARGASDLEAYEAYEAYQAYQAALQEEAEMERLRLELQALRHRVLSRAAGGY